eukprot:scaffold105400_cov30-Tisochrysis_lutea.AAC.4
MTPVGEQFSLLSSSTASSTPSAERCACSATPEAVCSIRSITMVGSARLLAIVSAAGVAAAGISGGVSCCGISGDVGTPALSIELVAPRRSPTSPAELRWAGDLAAHDGGLSLRAELRFPSPPLLRRSKSFSLEWRSGSSGEGALRGRGEGAISSGEGSWAVAGPCAAAPVSTSGGGGVRGSGLAAASLATDGALGGGLNTTTSASAAVEPATVHFAVTSRLRAKGRGAPRVPSARGARAIFSSSLVLAPPTGGVSPPPSLGDVPFGSSPTASFTAVRTAATRSYRAPSSALRSGAMVAAMDTSSSSAVPHAASSV